MDALAQLREMHDFPGGTLRFPGMDALVAEYGQSWQSVSWKSWRGRGYRRMKVKGCFRNAFDHSERHEELTYVEGLADAGYLPIHHAWCITPEGQVVDPTWRESNHSMPVTDWEYFGIPLESSFIWSVLAQKHTYGVLDHLPLYEEGLPDTALPRAA